MSDTSPPWFNCPATGPIFRPDDAARYTARSRSQYYADAAAGRLPAPFKLSGANAGLSGASGVPKNWLDIALDALARESLSPEPAQ